MRKTHLHVHMQQVEVDVNDLVNGMPAPLLGDVQWRKSGRSNPSGNCVEVAPLAGEGGVAVRNSRDPHGPALIYTRAEIEAFLCGVKDGDFDYLM